VQPVGRVVVGGARRETRHDERMQPSTPPVDGGVDASHARRYTAGLLWEACHRHPRPEVVRDAISRGANVDLATKASLDHRIAPLLWRALTAAEACDDLGEARAALSDVYEVYRMEAVLLLPRAVSLAVEPLTTVGLEPVVLKGPALASRYPEPGLRPMEDIDLLLPAAQHQQALRALDDAGWVVVRPADRGVYDTVLTHKDVPALALELHYALEPGSQRVTALDPTALWNRRQQIDCLGTDAFGLPLPEEVVYLSAHAGKPHHGFFRMVWIADFAMITGFAAEAGDEIDWSRIRAVAADASCTTVVAAALALARRAGVNSPEGLFTLPTKGWRGAAIRQLTDVEWPLAHLELPGYHLNYALADTRRRRWQILLVLLGSGYGIGKAWRRLVRAPAALATRVANARRQRQLG
jgi:hypothetical protein